MQSRDFCFWLQGFFELRDVGVSAPDIVMSSEQVEMIRGHLALVFEHEIDPSMGPQKVQTKLNKIHNGIFKKNDFGQTLVRC